MAKTVYVNKFTGDNTWDGLSPIYVSGTNGPKKTIVGARAATASGDLVLIAPGVYLEPLTYFTASTDHLVLYRRNPTMPGRVIVDFENVSGRYWYTTWNYSIRFMDMHFRNPAPGSILFQCNDGLSRFYHCVFYDQAGSPGVSDTRGIQKYNSGGNDIALYNCTFWNLSYGIVDLTLSPAYNNYFVNVSVPFYSPAGTLDHNAYSGNAEANGINTSTGANPGLVDAAGGDFSLDPDTSPADWQTFMTGGYAGGRIGAFSQGGVYYEPYLSQCRFLSQDPTPANGNPSLLWENEGPNGTNTYTDGTPGDIIEDTGNDYRLIIDLTTTPAATGGRIRSEVFDMGSTLGVVEGIAWSGDETPSSGSALDINTTLPFQQEYRSSATSFLKGDASPSWTAFTQDTNIAQTGHRYIQFRITFRTDHTNA